jgi:ribosomal protein S18 acetylase RimI-like enzyme
MYDQSSGKSVQVGKMPAIDIRPAISSDITALIQFVHSIETGHTWQLDCTGDADQINVSFHKIRLPRSVKLEYPKNPSAMINSWTKHGLFLIGRIGSQRCGYLVLDLEQNQIGWVVDLVVDEPFRRQGVASALIIASQDWLRANGIYQIVLEMPIKNEAAIALATKLGFKFNGYMDRYFSNREIAVFYSAFLR